jgi:hypothetical protein
MKAICSLFLACFLTGCATWTSVQHEPPKSTASIRSIEKANLVWWLQNRDSTNHTFAYWIRNPCHNFTFYVLGVADKKTTIYGIYPASPFTPKNGFNFTVTHYRWRWLPFVSYHKNSFHAYHGWRPSGNFGNKLNWEKSPKKKPPAG